MDCESEDFWMYYGMNVKKVVEDTMNGLKSIVGSRTEIILEPETGIEAGLCKDRHTMNLDKFIFQSSDADTKMFDYDWQCEKVKDFIRENIKFDENGVPNKHLTIYTTGLNCYNASVMRACVEMKVNLEFKHYDIGSCSYKKQRVISSFEEKPDDATKFGSLFNHTNGKLYISGDPKVDIPTTFYMINVAYSVEDSSINLVTDIEDETVYIDSASAWKAYEYLVTSFFNERKMRISVFLDLVGTGIINPEENGGIEKKFIRFRRNMSKFYSYHQYKNQGINKFPQISYR